MEDKYFLAVCKDRLEDPEGFYYTVYFVNNSNEMIEKIKFETYGFASMDEELIETSHFRKELGNVAPFSAIEMEIDDEGSFDFTINFIFEMTINNKVNNKQFTIGKYLRGNIDTTSPLPVLNKMGYAYKAN